MTRAEPTTIRVRLSISIRFDLPNAANLCNIRPYWLPTWWICIVFVLIDDEANNKDADAGVVTATVPDDDDDRMCHVSGDDDWWCNLCNCRGDDNVECTEKHKREIWLLFYWCMKEKYDCYLIDTRKNNMIVNLNRLMIPHLTCYTSMK